MKLFDDKIRTDDEPAKHLDNTYDFYDRSKSVPAGNVRNQLNTWFDNYPLAEKTELKRRFQTALLFLHELFHRQGFSLEPHPVLMGTTKRPDYLVKGHRKKNYTIRRIG